LADFIAIFVGAHLLNLTLLNLLVKQRNIEIIQKLKKNYL
tara:strand:- start:969 stop:1088 length:120 start_codon:yes stop_codon:yes gene_type:complete